MTDQTLPDIVRLAMEFKAELRRSSLNTTIEMAEYWARISGDFDITVQRITDEILTRAAMGETITMNWINELNYYKELERQVYQEYRTYSNYTKGLIEDKSRVAMDMGVSEAEAMILGSQRPFSRMTFNRLATSEVEALYGAFRKGTPLDELFAPLGKETFKNIGSILGSSLAMGTPIPMIAKQLKQANTMGMNRAMVVARTEILRAHRTATQEAYLQSGVITKYKRFVNRSSACIACLLKDGEVFDSRYSFTDHPNGACSMIPWVRGGKEPKWEYGKDWFLKQNEATQRARMGNQYFEAWKKEEISLNNVSSFRYDKRWGNSPQKTPLWQLKLGNVRGDFGAENRQLPLAKKYNSQAKSIEPKVTSALERVASNTGGKLEGLEFKFKSFDSLQRKIEQDAWIYNLPFNKVDINDALRYTVTYDAKDLAMGYAKIQKELKSMGFKEIAMRNYFAPGKPYQGLNTNWISKDGKIFELQVHTPQSFYIKDKINHGWYEEYRKLMKGSPRLLELENLMIESFTKYGYVRPYNWENIGNIILD